MVVSKGEQKAGGQSEQCLRLKRVEPDYRICHNAVNNKEDVMSKADLIFMDNCKRILTEGV